MFAFHRAANFDKIYLIASDFKCLKHHVRCDHTNKINFIQLYFMTQSQFQGLCCLKFLFAYNTQLQRVVMYFEIRWGENTHGVVPDYISCLTVSSIHPALQMLQLPINIRGKGLKILPLLPATCVYPLPAAMHVSQTSLCITFFDTTVMKDLR